MPMTKKRILSVTTKTPDDGAEWFRVKKINNILRSNSYDVDVLSHTKKKVSENATEQLDYIIKSSREKSIFKQLYQMISREEEYDLIIGNNHLATFFCLAEKMHSNPILYDLHGDMVSEHLFATAFSNDSLDHIPDLKNLVLKEIIQEGNLRVSDGLNCVSHRMINRLIREGHPEDQLHYVTNGADVEHFNPVNRVGSEVRKQYGLNGLVFGYIGSFKPWQGVDQLIGTGILSSGSESYLIVGKSRENEENVVFPGRIDRSRVPDFYDACDVLVLPRPAHPGTEVAAPTKFAEYAAMGKPILTTDVGDPAEYVREYNCGIVVENNSVEELYSGISEMKQLSQQERESMGQRARELAVDHLSLKQMEKNLLSAVEKTVRS